MTRLGSEERPLRVAIVGAGPSGFYAAEHLQERDDLIALIDMYDRLPTPFGLVRGGVAPDHQKIKSVTRVYDRIATHSHFRFFGNVEFGRDVTDADLADHYHAAIYATGARTDRRMGIPGEELPGSHPATEFVGWYNAHPDFHDVRFDLSGAHVVIVGNGNVAIDIARILASPPELLAETDIADEALAALRASRVRTITVLGRRGPAQAAFTAKELKGLASVPEADVVVEAGALADGPPGVGEGDPRTLELLRELAVRPRTKAAREIHLRFLASPVEILGTERVERLVVAENELYEGSGGRLRARPSGRYETIPADLVLRAIGYRGVALPGVPFDEGRGVIPNVGGRMLDGPEGAPMPGEYVVGWIKRGPRGIIGTNKPDAQETVEALLADLAEGHLRDPYRPEPAAVDELLGRRKQDYVTYEDWQIIDELERARGAETGRARRKFARIEEMLDALAERKDAIEVADEALEVEAPEG